MASLQVAPSKLRSSTTLERPTNDFLPFGSEDTRCTAPQEASEFNAIQWHAKRPYIATKGAQAEPLLMPGKAVDHEAGSARLAQLACELSRA